MRELPQSAGSSSLAAVTQQPFLSNITVLFLISSSIPLDPAGHFGSYNCSASLVLVESIFDWIRNNLNESTGKNIDFIVYTGDSVGNHLTLINPYSAFEYMGIVSRLFQSYFPGIPYEFVLHSIGRVVFTPGNHDSFPPDQWSILDSFNTHNWYKQIQVFWFLLLDPLVLYSRVRERNLPEGWLLLLFRMYRIESSPSLFLAEERADDSLHQLLFWGATQFLY